MLIGGLWHGASWTFVVWGGLHGSFLVIERWIQGKRNLQQNLQLIPIRNSIIPYDKLNGTIHNILGILFTFFLVNLAWVFFRAEDFTSAWRLLLSMFGLAKNGAAILPTIDLIKVGVITTGLLLTHYLMRNNSVLHLISKQKWWVVSIAWSLMLILILLSQKSSGSFIYFQF